MSLKKTLYAAMLCLLVLFGVQNTESVTISFLLWEFTLPRAIILAATFGLGFLSHLLFVGFRRQRKEPDQRPRQFESSDKAERTRSYLTHF